MKKIIKNVSNQQINIISTFQSLIQQPLTKIHPKETISYSILPINSSSSKPYQSILDQDKTPHSIINYKRKTTKYLNSIKQDLKNSFCSSNNYFLTEVKLTRRNRVIQMPTDSNFLIEKEYYKSVDDNILYKSLKQKIIKVDIVIAILSVCSLIMSFIDTEMFINSTQDYLSSYLVTNNMTQADYESYRQLGNRPLSIGENILRSFNGIFSISNFILLFVRYHYLNKINQYDSKLLLNDNIIFGNYINMIIESIICLIVFFPGLNAVRTKNDKGIISAYAVNSIFAMFTLFKLYFLYRIIIETTRWNSRISQAICGNYQIKPGFQFLIKCEIKYRPIMSIIAFIFLFICLMALIMRCFEFATVNIIPQPVSKKGINSLTTFWNCVWFILITITAVGFGDVFPKTFAGQLISLIPFIFGALILGLTIATIYSFIEFKPEERKAYLKLTKIFDFENYEHKAANLIKAILFLKRLNTKQMQFIDSRSNKQKKMMIIEKFILLLKLKTEIAFFINDYYVSRAYSMPIDDLMKTMGFKLYDSLIYLTKQIDKMYLIENDLHIMKSNQEFIQYKLQHIALLQDEITNNLVQFQNQNFLNENSPDYNAIKLNIRPNINILSSSKVDSPKTKRSQKMKKKNQHESKSNNNLVEKKSSGSNSNDGKNIKNRSDQQK